jgi:uncharacterized cupin superfamily protein
MPKIDISTAPETKGSRYPAPFDEPCRTRSRKRLGDAAGLTQFGVNLLTLQPGAWSSQRHWHTGEDEFVYIVSGEVVLKTDAGEETLRAGDCAAFPKDDGNGHHLMNRSAAPALLLEVGTRSTAGDIVRYPEIDLMIDRKDSVFSHRDGTPYPAGKG